MSWNKLRRKVIVPYVVFFVVFVVVVIVVIDVDVIVYSKNRKKRKLCCGTISSISAACSHQLCHILPGNENGDSEFMALSTSKQAIFVSMSIKAHPCKSLTTK